MPWITTLSVVDKGGRITLFDQSELCRPRYQRQLLLPEDPGDPRLRAQRPDHEPADPAAAAAANYPTSAVEGGLPSVIIAGLNMDWMAKLMSGLVERPGIEAVLLDGKGTVPRLTARPGYHRPAL